MSTDATLTAVEDLIRDGALLINDGYRAKNSELSSTGMPFARAGNINDGFKFDDADCVPPETLAKVGNKRSKPGDVVFTSKGTVGRFAYVREGTPEFVYSPQLCYWRSGDAARIDSHWLYYWMNGREFFEQFKGVAGQTDMAEYVSLRDQRAMKITLPPLPEQKAIARILGTLDDKIESNRRMNATLEAMARALFQSWFVDFDPVHAKAAGRHPAGMDEKTAALFPDSFQDSALGQIPSSWQITTVGECCERIFSGGTPNTSTADYWGGDIPWLSSGETRNALIVETEKTITQAGIENSSTKLARAGCTVIASAGQGHTRGQTSLLTVDSYINQSVVALAANPEVSSDLFLFFDLGRRYEEFRQLSDSHSSRGSLTTKLLANVRCVLPKRELLAEFDKAVNPVVRQITENLRQSRILATLRDTLLPKLLSGELAFSKTT